jgi:Ca-activated chloride channel family protein
MTPLKGMLFCLVLGLSLVLPKAALPQTALPETASIAPVFSVGLDVVKLTVSVRDAQGHLVSDLGADDFVVLEDGRPQTVQIFARATQLGQEESLALDVGLLMDTSESMIKELRLSREAAVRFLDAIPRARDLLTVFFDQDIRVSRYDSEHQQGLIERLEEAQGSGYTALYDAIAVYLSRVQEGPGRKVLVLFTDGEDTTSQTNLHDLLAMVRSSSVTIYPIGFFNSFLPGSLRGNTSRGVLRDLAVLSGGGLFSPTTSKDLPVIYQQILEELSSQYVLGFSSDRPASSDKYRRLRVDVKRPGLKVRHREGYTPSLTAPVALGPH